MRKLIIAVIVVALLVAGGAWYLTRTDADITRYEFAAVTSFTVDGNAEIVTATPDGNTLVHTNTKRRSIDLVDITDPALPRALTRVAVPGEPTSVAISPDGNWALATIYLGASEPASKPRGPHYPGGLALLNIADPATAQIVDMIGIGHHPDSIAVTHSGPNLYAIIAIENEPLIVTDGLVVDADEPGNPDDISQPGRVQIVSFDPDRPGNYRVSVLDLSPERLERSGLLFTADPQPEFIAVAPDQTFAAVSLQENNGIVLFDPYNLEIKRTFSLGVVADRPTDLTDDGRVAMIERYPGDVTEQTLAGARLPDGIAFTPGGDYIVSADEGAMPLTGGRGFSVWTTDGEFVWDDAGDLEQRAAAAGMYPDERSASKGIEVEGVTTARFGIKDYAFVLAERGSFMAIYDISNPRLPLFVQLLASGRGPESAVAIPERGLVVVAAEKSGSLDIYSHNAGKK